MLELEIWVFMLCYLLHFSHIFQFISALRMKKRKESNRNPEIQAINGESKSGTDAAGNEVISAAPRLSLQPQSAQAPSTANRPEFLVNFFNPFRF